jgi:flavin-dependent thymidylate synthase
MEQASSLVRIIAFTPEPERLAASAAGISTTKGTALEIYGNNQDLAKAQKLIKNVLRLGHTTTIEHACFTLAFENVSAFVEQFMIEFRLASFTVKSRRYVDFSQMGYYQPEFRFAETVGESVRQKIHNLYNTHIKKLFSEYEFFEANGIPREDARFLLPYCYRSNFYCTVNARELHHIIFAALWGRGSKYPELQQIGQSLWEQTRQIAPAIFETILPESRDDKEQRLREALQETVGGFGDPALIKRDDLAAGEASQVASPAGGPAAGLLHWAEPYCELLYSPQNPEIIVTAGALIKHGLFDSTAARKAVAEHDELRQQILAIICEDNRKRELEQVSFTFRINNLTLAGLTHLVRHRMQSVNVPSFTEFGLSKGFVLPSSIRENPQILARYRAVLEEHQQVFQQFREAGVLAEDLVYLYLSGNLVDVVTTMNGRELFHFLRLRTCTRAQWEIRAIAMEMLDQLRALSPALFCRFGPSCYVLGKCPEGKLSCGRQAEMQVLFGGKDGTN